MSKKTEEKEVKPEVNKYRIPATGVFAYVGGQIYKKKDNKVFTENPEVLKLAKAGWLELIK